MGKPVLKNWKPKEVIKFIKKNRFIEIKSHQGGDHRCLFNKTTKAYTEVDMGHKSFSAREMLTFAKQSKIDKSIWLKSKK